jgi:uncharacterized membrane protein YccF (DUF307 family)
MLTAMATRVAQQPEAAHRPMWLRVIWFVLVGWWASALTLAVAYVCMLTIIGLPLAFWIFDRVPLVLTLKPRSHWTDDAADGGVTRGPDQLSLIVRALYFLLVGWWFSGIWITAAYVMFVTIIGIPVGVVMLNLLPAVVTLQRN